MAATALRPAVVDFMRLATTSERLDLSAEQVEIGADAPFVGKTLREANFRQAFGVIVVAIKRADGHMQFNPRARRRDRGGRSARGAGRSRPAEGARGRGPRHAVAEWRTGARESARRLDGAALAARRFAPSWRRGSPPLRAAHGRPPGLARRPRRQRSRIRDLRPQQDEGRGRSRLPRRAGSARRARPVVSDALATVARLNADAGDRRDPRAVAAARRAWARDAEQRVFDALDPAKDVDGFHPENVGRLVQKRPTLVACTPLGCIELLERERIPIAGRTPSSSAAATSSASRWRCCCCIATRR